MRNLFILGSHKTVYFNNKHDRQKKIPLWFISIFSFCFQNSLFYSAPKFVCTAHHTTNSLISHLQSNIDRIPTDKFIQNADEKKNQQLYSIVKQLQNMENSIHQ